MNELHRVTFDTARAAEFLDRRALQAQTGRLADQFGEVVLKELVDNALDAAESAKAEPAVEISMNSSGHLTVSDNGTGMPAEVVQRILDFNVTVSDKAAYRSPTRGLQGNALKTILGIPYALGVTEPVVVEAHGIRHEIAVSLDPAGNAVTNYVRLPSARTIGTAVRVPLPVDLVVDVSRWARAFAVVNPHAAVGHLDNDDDTDCSILYKPTAPEGWRKPVPADPTSPHWYDETAMKRLVFSHIGATRKGAADLPVGEFVRSFAGLSSTVKAKAVRAAVPGVEHLSDFEHAPEKVGVLLAAMKAEAKVVKPESLGEVPEEHYRTCLDDWYGVERFWFKRKRLLRDGVPWVIEIAVAVTREPGEVFYAANYSPTYGDQLGGTFLNSGEMSTTGGESFLRRCDAYPDGSNNLARAAVVHVICPALEFTDKGKTQLGCPVDVAVEFAGVFKSVTKVLAAEKKRRERDARTAGRQSIVPSDRTTLKDAVFEVMPAAIAHESGDGAYPFPTRNLLYAVRRLIQPHTYAELTGHYFSQTLVVEWEQDSGPIPGHYRDPRGNLHEPHTGVRVPLGTREVAGYQLPEHLYDKILYVEKEGFGPIFQRAHLAERYDLAIASGKGQPVEAVRALFERAERGGEFRLFVLHDADHNGYSIARTIAEETERMPDYSVDVIDLGLNVNDAIALGLQTERYTRRKALPWWMPSRLSDVEREWYEGTQISHYPRQWECTRVELNALGGPRLIEYIEQGLAAAGADGKVIPPADVIDGETEDAFTGHLSKTVTKLIAEIVGTPALISTLTEEVRARVDLDVDQDTVEEALYVDREQRWTKAVADVVAGRVGRAGVDLRARLVELLAERGV